MGSHEKTSAAKIRDGEGAASSSLSGESVYTPTKVQMTGNWGVFGEPMAKKPRWRLEENLGVNERMSGLTLQLQPRLVVPSDGLLAA